MKRTGLILMKNEQGEFLWEYKGRLLRLSGDEIYYLHTEQRKMFVHTENRVYEVAGKLEEAERFLEQLPLVRTHCSYLVNIRHLEHIDGQEAVLKNGERIPVSERRKKTVCHMIRYAFGGKKWKIPESQMGEMSKRP